MTGSYKLILLVHAETRRRGGIELVDDTMEPIFKGCSAKIDQKTDGKIHKAKISQQLFAVNRGHFLYGFQLNHHSTFYQQINSKPIVKT
jgi:hypothetical protein